MSVKNISHLRFKFFQFLWLVFILFHMFISSPGWSTVGNEFLNPSNHFFLVLNFFVVIFAMLSVFHSNKLHYFLFTILCLTIVKLDALPSVPNHIILMLIIHLTILLSLLLYWNRSLELPERIATWFDKTAPYLRFELLIMYFFVVLHKLNYDYFNSSVSCSVELYTDIASAYPFFPQGVWMHWIIIGSILSFELAIPVLLMIPKTRVLGVFIGLIFHFILSLHPNLYILSFTAELYALYVLFLPAKTIDKIAERLKQLNEQIGSKKTVALSAGICIIGFGIFITFALLKGANVSTVFLKKNLGTLFLDSVHTIWIIGCILLVAGAALTFRSQLLHSSQSSSSQFKLSWSPLLLLLMLTILNGISPYIGLKTATNFSMFSNLRVDGSTTNHLFMPASYQVSGFQNDTVTILSTNNSYLQGFIERNEHVTYFQLSRFLSENLSKDIQVTFLRNGNKQTINLSQKNSPVFLESSWIARKLLLFRGIPKSGPTPCQW